MFAIFILIYIWHYTISYLFRKRILYILQQKEIQTLEEKKRSKLPLYKEITRNKETMEDTTTK